MESTITQIQSQGTYVTQRGDTMYKFECQLADGTSGEVSAKTPDRWSVGDPVEYTKQDTQWGPKLRLHKPGMQNGHSSAGSGNVEGQIASWAVTCAVQSLPPLANVNVQEVQAYREQVEKVAQAMLQARATIKPNVQP